MIRTVMKDTKQLRNGSLYFNSLTERVERVLGKVNNTRVWTKRKKQPAQDVQTKHLRLASKDEWNSYLDKKSGKRAAFVV